MKQYPRMPWSLNLTPSRSFPSLVSSSLVLMVKKLDRMVSPCDPKERWWLLINHTQWRRDALLMERRNGRLFKYCPGKTDRIPLQVPQVVVSWAICKEMWELCRKRRRQPHSNLVQWCMVEWICPFHCTTNRRICPAEAVSVSVSVRRRPGEWFPFLYRGKKIRSIDDVSGQWCDGRELVTIRNDGLRLTPLN